MTQRCTISERPPGDTISLRHEHYLISVDFFTPEQWNGSLAPLIDRLIARPGGILLISVEIAPEQRNYPIVAFGVFDAEERKAFKAALERARKKRRQGRLLNPQQQWKHGRNAPTAQALCGKTLPGLVNRRKAEAEMFVA